MSDSYRAILRDVRITPRKAGLVAAVVRGKSVSDALDALKLMKKKGAPIYSKLINAAMANAMDKATVDVDRLYVSEAYVGKGVTWKRFLPRAQGRATPVRKRTSNITIKLKEL